MREYEYCLDTCSLYVSVDTYKRRKKKFGWMEVGIVVKIHVPIHNIEGNWRRAQSNLRMRPEWTYSRGAAGDSRSSMYKMYISTVYAAIHIKGKDWDIMSYLCDPLFMLNYLLLIACSSVIYVLCLISPFICRLKIHHDSHEFILDFGTVVNNSQ
jgi:hypothetical protein